MGEAVGLQLESEYRARIASAHAQVKKRLDYQLETGNVLRRMEQKHMVDWIIGNAKASITPAQETAALKKCISDLSHSLNSSVCLTNCFISSVLCAIMCRAITSFSPSTHPNSTLAPILEVRSSVIMEFKSQANAGLRTK